MRMEQERRLLREENAVLKFNAAHNVGVTVRFWTGLREGEGRIGVTWTDARIMCEHAVVYVRDEQGKNVGAISLTHIEPVESAVAS